MAFEETEHLRTADFAEWNNEPNGIISWYCLAMWPKVTLYGTRPPSRVSQKLDHELYYNSYNFEVEDGSVVLVERYGKGRFDNLEIAKHELNDLLERFRSGGLPRPTRQRKPQ